MITVIDHKEPQKAKPSEKFLTPKKLYLPLSQHTGKPSNPCVKISDLVQEAQLIAKADGYISSNLHAPVSGKIAAVERYNHPVLQSAEAIVLEPSGTNKEYLFSEPAKSLKKEELLEIIAQAGIVGMGGAAFPSQVKLKPPKKIITLIINGCECEPYLTCDHRLMLENLKEIFLGIEIICRIIEPSKVIFAIEENKPDVIKQLNLYVNTKKFNLPALETVILPHEYPQGSEKQLIYNTTNRKVPGGKLPLDVGCLVHNVATCFAIYQAVYYSKPLIERLVSFCGEALTSPKNIWVKIGTSLRELFEQKILELDCEPAKIISGGPLMGIALTDLDYPILKSTGGFLFLKPSPDPVSEQPCLKCARCVDNCPMGLLPLEYVRQVKRENYESLTGYNINDCIECGCCTYGCPAKISLVHYIKIGKGYVPKSN
ncbi:MAG: electron transport complex subunit RsxC [Candidatus Omnitrophica bacterium]|nr:electron transport complex subunit RsxC [Candidatus Omnitrophota bacterium]MBU2044436.1 electron transport complex subunit RsxC [Candidatus Omnitrophota bacterium]MBU2250718.1 electron transport complex subunit RsxC [Candidatus Omnitrophota bacterium]MBU2473724.1 electron transport complex subunit RsxC [Candidatus Omnitrophota bacterium]